MITVEQSGPVAILTIGDCRALSRHAEAAGRELRDALTGCGDRDDLKVIVLRSNAADFCAPLEPGPSRPLADQVWGHHVYASSSGLYQMLCYSNKVTIAAIQGECAGAGSLIALCADLVLASPDARFHSPFDTMPEANFALAALTMRLNRVKAWMLGGVPLDAERAIGAGLINRIVPGDMVAASRSLAAEVARMPLDGIAISKLVMETSMDAQGVGQDFDMVPFYAAAAAAAAAVAGDSNGRAP